MGKININKVVNEIEFLPIGKLSDYLRKGFTCTQIIFDPEEDWMMLPPKLYEYPSTTPPYIRLEEMKQGFTTGKEVYFEVPDDVAAYAAIHRRFTRAGADEYNDRGARDLANGIKKLLQIGED